MTKTDTTSTPKVNWSRFEVACKVAEQGRDGVIPVIITGKGEPTLYPNLITQYLRELDWQWPLVELNTNGTRLTPELLDHWREYGMTSVSISITHFWADESNKIMGLPDDVSFWKVAKMVQDAGLSVRLNCTLVKGGVDTVSKVIQMIGMAKTHGIDQLTLRPVARPKESVDPGAAAWVDENNVNESVFFISKELEDHGTPLLHLPGGGKVYDYKGQNVALASCLTTSNDPNNIRQIIFLPDGRICYDWSYPGARIL
jgi:molybdenum cofactor biosynthesis enzyme MoaA